MGLTTKTVNSSLLGKKMNIAVCVPDAYENIPLPVLYFLHGRTGNETLLQWFEMDKRASSLIESGIIKPLIIVCPNMDNSRGINSSEHYQEVIGKYGLVHKGRYEDYLLKEVISYLSV